MKRELVKFEEFLKENVKSEVWNFNAYCNDLLTQWGDTGRMEYELSGFESKTGNPILFDYDEELLKELGIEFED